MAKTKAMIDNSTRTMDMEDSSRLYLTCDIIFEGKNDKYEIISKELIGSGGESLVYKAKMLSDGEEAAAKIHDKYNPNDRANIMNRELVIKFLKNNSEYKKTHIMPLYDSGDITINVDDHDYKLPVDIMPFCKSDTLLNKKVSYSNLRQKIIPGILKALNLLHSERLVHRDIKPNNLYLLNKTFVLADFGTTSKILSGSSVGLTETRRGTPGYRAPEVWGGFFDEAADYYSLGCTIATLYKGEHVYQRILDSGNEAELNASMSKGLPLDCPEEEADLQELVNSLVMRDGKDRAGYDDVLNWLNDVKLFQKNWKSKLQKGYETASASFQFKEHKCSTKAELTDAMLSDWEYAKQYLYKGGEKNSAIVNYLSKEDQNLSLKAIEIIEENRNTVNNQDLGLAMFLHYFNTTDDKPCPIYWNGKTYNKLEEISKEISSNNADENSIIKMLENKFLSWKFTNTKGTKEETIETVKKIEEITVKEKCKYLGYYTLMYRFSQKEEIENITADKIFWDLTNKKEDWQKTVEQSINNDKMLAFLFNLRYEKHIIEFKEGCTGNFYSENGYSDILSFYKLFEGICESKEYIRDHYLKYGPQANLYNQYITLINRDLNSFVSNDAKKNIKNLKFNLEMCISDLYSNFMLFKKYLKDEEEEKIRIEKERIEKERQEKQKILDRKLREEKERLESIKRAEQEKIDRERLKQQKIEEANRQFREITRLSLNIAPHLVAAILFGITGTSSGGMGIGGFIGFAAILLIPIAILNFADSEILRGFSIIVIIILLISCIGFSLMGDSNIGWIACIFIVISSIVAFIRPLQYEL